MKKILLLITLLFPTVAEAGSLVSDPIADYKKLGPVEGVDGASFRDWEDIYLIKGDFDNNGTEDMIISSTCNNAGGNTSIDQWVVYKNTGSGYKKAFDDVVEGNAYYDDLKAEGTLYKTRINDKTYLLWDAAGYGVSASYETHFILYDLSQKKLRKIDMGSYSPSSSGNDKFSDEELDITEKNKSDFLKALTSGKSLRKQIIKAKLTRKDKESCLGD